MNFNDYLDKIKKLMLHYNISESYINKNIEDIFESYINNESTKFCVKKYLKNLLTESTNKTNNFKKYTKNVLNLLEKQGYNSKVYYRILKETINDYYNSDIDAYNCSSDCAKFIKQNTLNISKTKNDIATDIQNKITYILHNTELENFYLINTKLNRNSITITCNIKLFELENIDTSIKGLCSDINKRLQPYIKLYTDAGSHINIVGYQLDKNDLYCRVNININYVESDGFKNNKFDVKEIAKIMQLYISIFNTFTEQNINFYHVN